MQPSNTITLQQRVQQAIFHHPHASLRGLHFHTDGSRVRIEGEAQTFFQKQLAQEILRSVDGIEAIENAVTVAW